MGPSFNVQTEVYIICKTLLIMLTCSREITVRIKAPFFGMKGLLSLTFKYGRETTLKYL